MNKGTHFSGQPMYGQLINLLNKEEILKFSREHNGERYVKRFDAYQHMAIMLYAVIRKIGAPDKPCGVGRADANPKLLLNDT